MVPLARWSILTLFLICPGSLAAQENPREVLTRVVNQIHLLTSYEFIDSATGRSLTAVPPGEVRPSVRLRSGYNDWAYFTGVILTGMMRVAEATGDSACRAYVLRNFRFVFDNIDYFREQWEVLQVPRAPFYRVFRMNMLDDCGAMGAALAEAYRFDPDPRFLRMVQRIANYIEHVQLRLGDGTLSRPDPRYMTLWADDLYMSVPFLVQAAILSREARYFDDAASQVKGFAGRLTDPATGLLRHAWFSDTKERSVAAWGRANGWAVMAEVELLKNLPEDHPMRDTLLALLCRHLEALCRYQDSSGLWHQVLDRPDSYLETSCSAMFCYGLATAVNRGWLDHSYGAAAKRAWRGVSSRVGSDGQVSGICRGTEVGFDFRFYYERPTPMNDMRGIGAVLLAGSEILAMEKR